MEINRIALTGDAFRTKDGQPDQISNVVWLERHFGPLLQSLTGLPVTIRFPLNAVEPNADSVRRWVSLQGEPGLDNWARSFWGPPTTALVDETARCTRNALVVGIELSPVLIAALDAAGTPWIDVGISPLRFLPDFAIHLRASRHFDLRAAPERLLTTANVEHAVGHIKARYRGSVARATDVVVFFAQTARDRTTIRDGGFSNAEDAITLMESVLDGRRLLVKPHPWEPGNPVVEALVHRFAGEITEANTYALLSAEVPPVVTTLSSSVGREARVFGCQTRIANPAVQDWAYSGVESVVWGRSYALWGPIMAGVLPVFRCKDSTPFQPNVLRREIGAFGLDAAIWD